MSDPIVIRLKPGLSREDAGNDGTISFSWVPRRPPELRELFVQNYEAIQSCREALPGPGVAVAVVGPSGFEGSAAVTALPDGINVLTIGRHSHARLFLSGEQAMSLRQGAVIVYPLAPGEGVRFRILDLRAACPFEDEHGRRLEALEANGPVFLRSGACTFFVIPKETGAAPWPKSAEKAWAAIPERGYLEEVEREPIRERFQMRADPSPSSPTLVLRLPGPSLLENEDLVRPDEQARGQLVVRSARGEMTLVMGRSAATRGVLLGRYERCDGSRLGVLDDLAISRVHALVIEVAGKLYAIDAGSTNGLWLGHERVASARLSPRAEVALAFEVATLEWSFTH